MSNDSQNRHVVILGAGASATSGYPLANKLRLLMSSESFLRHELSKDGELPPERASEAVREMTTGPMAGTIELFRHGGFATADEFCYLARSKFFRATQEIKGLLRFALAIHDPEQNFQSSDYYPFVQKLFCKDLFPLRSDVSILTFNYDPYLPYLLKKAYELRATAVGKRPESNTLDAITSGFSFRNVGALESGNDLCVLQLHGSLAWPRRNELDHTIFYGDLFGVPASERISKLCFSDSKHIPAPIFFPWEILKQDGQFLNEREFCYKEGDAGDVPRGQGAYDGTLSVYQLFIAIWKRAQKEVSRATKVSFVGLSMHDFLNPALAFLFKERLGSCPVVCVSKEHKEFGARLDTAYLSPRTPAGKLHRLLPRICPSLEGVSPPITSYESFQDFIVNEMD